MLGPLGRGKWYDSTLGRRNFTLENLKTKVLKKKEIGSALRVVKRERVKYSIITQFKKKKIPKCVYVHSRQPTAKLLKFFYWSSLTFFLFQSEE